jgi:CHAT domain-containing protein
MFTAEGDSVDALHAKVGFMRATAETGSFPELSAFLTQQLNTPLVQSNPHLRLWCLTAKGMTDIETNISSAEADWQAAEALAGQLGESAWKNRASGELGLIAFMQGDPKRASILVGGALLTAMARGDNGGQIRYLELLGNALNELDRQDEALRFFDRAIKVASKTPDAGFPFMTYEGRAQALTALNRPAQAKATLLHTLTEAETAHKQGHEAQVLMLLGENSLSLNDTSEGIQYLEKAGHLATFLGFYRMVAQSMLDLANAYSQTGDFSSAEQRLESGLQASRRVDDRYYLPRDLNALAELQAQTGHPREAHQLYAQAEDFIDGMLIRIPGPYTESSLLDTMSRVYLGDFRLEADQGDVSEALAIIERARGRTAADELRNPKASLAESPDAQRAANALADLQTRLIQSNDPGEKAELLDQLDEREQELAYLTDSIVATGPLTVEHPIALAVVQHSLDANQAILEYVLAEPQAFCLVITRSRASVIRLPAGQKEIESLTAALLKAIRADEPLDREARRLYDWLIAPIPSDDPRLRLVVIPDGQLHNLPFECLQDASGRYLVESHIVSYAPSATALCLLKGEHRSHAPELAYLGVGGIPYRSEAVPPNGESVSGHIMRAASRGLFDLAGLDLGNLPASREEVIETGRILAQPNSVLLTGIHATETAFKREPLGEFEIIHLAVHAYESPGFPERNALLLGRDPNSSDDGLLQAREIVRLPLNADLVTLSACDTGTGKAEGEEGNFSLVQAFLLAGARSVVAALWDVDDLSTADMMKLFYAALARGEDEASALRTAKLQMLTRPAERPPRYWAGLTLNGYGDSPVRFSK